MMKSHIGKQSLTTFLSSFHVRIFPFSPWAPMGSKISHCKIHYNSVRNCSKKGKVELCVMKSHIRKQSLRKLLSIYYVRIFPFSPRAPMSSKIPLCSFHEILLAICSKKGRVELCVMKSHIGKQSLRKLLSSYYVSMFPLHHGSFGLPNITLHIPRKEC